VALSLALGTRAAAAFG